MIFADSLISGFLGSNLMGQGIVVIQLLGSVVMVTTIIGKFKELAFLSMATRRFLRDVVFEPVPDKADKFFVFFHFRFFFHFLSPSISLSF